jgi:hypothetical protein
VCVMACSAITDVTFQITNHFGSIIRFVDAVNDLIRILNI